MSKFDKMSLPKHQKKLLLLYVSKHLLHLFCTLSDCQIKHLSSSLIKLVDSKVIYIKRCDTPLFSFLL